MRISGRVVMVVVVLLGATGAFKSCGTGKTSGGEDPPQTANDIVQVSATGAASVAVLANDQHLVNEPLVLTIDQASSVGTASFNSDRTVRLDLPAGFRGVTRFKYKITNALGGFSISTAVVFVDVPAYRVFFAAKSATQPYELFVTDLVSAKQISQATSGNVRLQNVWRSSSGSLIAYERADPAQVASTTELFFVKTGPIASPVKVAMPTGRSLVASAPVTTSSDDKWIAFATAPTGTGQSGNNLYVLDTTSAHGPVAVGLSTNLLPVLTQWAGTDPTVYFMSAPGGTGGAAVYRATTSNLDSPERVSPTYATGDTQAEVLVSPDQTKLVIVGAHAGQNGAFFVDPASPNVERRLTTDIPAGAVIESFQLNSDFSQLTYLWRLGNATNARLSVVAVGTSGVPRTVLEAPIGAFTGLKADGTTALITRGTGGRASDGTLYEVSLDRSTADLPIAANVNGGAYDDTGDRVYLSSTTVAPSVINRSDFDHSASPLVRGATPPLALFVTSTLARSAAIVEDPTSGLVLVNASAPGKTIQLSDLQVGSVDPTFLPAAIVAPP